MATGTDLTMECESFAGERVGDAAVIRFRKDQLLLSADLVLTRVLTEYLECVAADRTVKTLVLIGPPEATGEQQYLDFFEDGGTPAETVMAARRMYNALDQFLAGIIASGKIVISAASGSIITDFLGIILAADHRVFAANTTFVNAHLKLGLPPKGGAAFFLSRQIGRSRAYELLLSRDAVPVEAALAQGLVDEVVPLDQLEERALEVAEQFSALPADALVAMKSMMNYSLRDISAYMDHESRVLERILTARSHA